MAAAFMDAPSSRTRTRADVSCLDAVRDCPRWVWKRFGDGECLSMLAVLPEGNDASGERPAVVFFHGGMWLTEHAAEFLPWALQLAARGIVCLVPEYRTRASHDVGALEILQDAADVWSWTLSNAPRLGIDPARVTLAGSDAGALMALHAGMPPARSRWRFGWPWHRRRETQPLPACIAVFRGIVDLEAPEAALLGLPDDGTDLAAFDPVQRLGKHLPLLFSAHGMLDPLLDCRRSEWFAEEWKACGNGAFHITCPHGDHAFLYFNVNPQAFEQILFGWESFMVERGVWSSAQMESELLLT